VKLFREPLLHFILIGAAIFVAYAWINQGEETTETDARTIHVHQEDVAWIKDIWSRQWHRDPTHEELHGLVSDYLREELLAREAHEMKLDDNDLVLRHRLAQKLTFLIEDAVQVAEPSDKELRAVYAAHPKNFQSSARITFSQVYFNPGTRKDAAADAAMALANLRDDSNFDAIKSLGDPLLVDSDYSNTDIQTVSAVFGPEFTQTVFALKPGNWSGPIRSGFGQHLVKVTDLQPSQALSFEDAHAKLLSEWQRQQETEANSKFMDELRKKYTVVVDESVRSIVDPQPRND
jgi:hypothetical protein